MDSPTVPSYLRSLNPEQQTAALTTEGPVLVLAGAGSGKTRMIVHRIVHLLRRSVPAREILAVTFTNRAAAEMRSRVAEMAGKEARGLTISTFHSLGARILREHGALLDLPRRFSIYATADQLALVKRIMAEEVRVTATAGDDVYDAKRVVASISGWKNRLAGPDEARAEVSGAAMRDNRSDDYAVLAADVYPRYEQALRAAGACDFDDLLLLPVALLRDHPDARHALWKRWRYLMIDEYQDTNGAQLELARLIAGPHRNICVVGDDDQSIYAWRGADMRNILEFEQHFPGARVVVLEENYRSTQRILGAANAVIAANTGRSPKKMRTANSPGARLDYWELEDGAERGAEQAEAEMVAREIGLRIFREGLSWGDFAVLYRTNHQSRVLEEALRLANVPYRVIGGTSYFDRKEIADAAAYLRLVSNPRDEVSLRRVINYPTRGIGRTTQLRLVEAARSERASIWSVLERIADGADTGDLELNTAQRAAVRDFVRIIREARAEVARVEEAAAHSADGESGFEGWAATFLRDLRLEEAIRQENKAERAADARIDNLRALTRSLGDFERRIWREAPLPDEEADWAPPTLAAFLERFSLVTEDEADEKDDDDIGQVTLLTLHSAKGLEFGNVFLVGLEEEILPHARTIGEIAEGSATDPVAEERRLFYVGITRARNRLTLSGCRTRMRNGEAMPRQPSRFLKDIPPELLEVRTPGAQSSLEEGDRQEMRESFFSRMKEMLGDQGASDSSTS
jgi:DNA helicase-2/ATP-dependent DNA helicase PcrA